MCVSLLPDRLEEKQRVGTFLVADTTYYSSSGHVLSGHANFCSSGYSQLWQWCHVIQSDMLNVYHSPPHLFSSFSVFIFSSVLTSETAPLASESRFLTVPSSWFCYCCECHTHSPSIFTILSFLCPWVAPGQALCAGFILPHRSLKLFNKCCIEWLAVIWQGGCLRVT